jgi:hypothetical protein
VSVPGGGTLASAASEQSAGGVDREGRNPDFFNEIFDVECIFTLRGNPQLLQILPMRIWHDLKWRACNAGTVSGSNGNG